MNLLFQPEKGFVARLGNDIVLANLSLSNFLFRDEVTRLFQSMENGINRPRADVIAMMPQFLDHFVAVNRVFGSVMKDVYPDEP